MLFLDVAVAQAVQVELVAEAQHLGLEGQALLPVDFVQLLGDAQSVAYLERPEDAADAHWDSKPPQVLQIDVDRGTFRAVVPRRVLKLLGRK